MARRVAQPPLNIAATNWGNRLNTMLQGGYKPQQLKAVKPLVEQDIKNVQRGGASMTDTEALLSMASAIKRQTVLQKQDSGWSPLDIPGDIVSDIKDVTWGAVPALARYAWHLPQNIGQSIHAFQMGSSKADTKWLVSHGYEPNPALTPENILDPSKWASALRSVAHDPILGAIPLVSTLAGTTTPKGREQLAHHPVMTALDVLPVAGAGGKIVAGAAGVETAADAAARAGTLAKAAGGSEDVVKQAALTAGERAAEKVPRGSALEAIAQGHPVQAAYKGLVPTATRAKVAGKTLDVMSAVGVHPESFNFARAHSRVSRSAQRELRTMMNEEGLLSDFKKLSQEDQSAFSQYAQYPDQRPNITPTGEGVDFADMVAKLDRANAKLASMVEGDFHTIPYTTPEGQTHQFLYPTDAPVAKAHRTHLNAMASLEAAQADAARALPSLRGNEIKRIRRKYEKRVPFLNRAKERLTAAEAAIEEARAAIDPETIGTVEGVNAAKAALDKVTKKRDVLAADVAKRQAEIDAIMEQARNPMNPRIAARHNRVARAEAKIKGVLQEDGTYKGGTQAAFEKAFREEAPAIFEPMIQKAMKERIIREISSLPEGGLKPGSRFVGVKGWKGETIPSRIKRRLEKGKPLEDIPYTTKPWPAEVERPAGSRAYLPATGPGKVVYDTAAELERRHVITMDEFQQLRDIMGDKSAVTMGEWLADVKKRVEASDLHDLLEPDYYQTVRKETMAGWQALADEGHMPSFVHSVPVHAETFMPNPRPFADRTPHVSQVERRAFDLTPKVENVGVALTAQMAEILRRRAWMTFDAQMITPFKRTWADIRQEVWDEAARMRESGEIGPNIDEAGALARAREKLYTPYRPEGFFNPERAPLTGTGTVGAYKKVGGETIPQATDVFVPKHIGKVLNDMQKMQSQSGGARFFRGSTKVYKASVMALSAKHMAHILFGGMMFLALRGGPEELSSLRQAWKMARTDTETGLRGMPAELATNIDLERPAELTSFQNGTKAAKAWNATLGKVAGAKWRFDEFVIDWQRSIAYLGEEKRALRKGMTRAEAQEAGLRHAEKALVDLDSMNPLERNTLRNVMPFYAFMRHTLRYIMTYPVDHPLRAAILSRIYSIEQKDWSSGLPKQMQSLMMLGSPSATGDQTGIEMRQFNPFRDTGDYFTWAGFIKGLNPAFAFPFEAMGVDKFTGTTPLYPKVAMDPQTGNLVAQRPKNLPWQAITDIFPEAQLADYFGGITGDLRDLKKRDPEAAKRIAMNAAFIPFLPHKVNLSKEAADLQRNQLALAQQDVSDALSTGDTSKLKKWPLIPYQGQLIPPATLIAVLTAAKKKAPNLAPRAAIPRVKIGG